MGRYRVRITYDSEVDAAYIYLTDKSEERKTRQVDEDIYLDFNGANRLVGIEVLDASARLDLVYLGPLVEEIGRHVTGWPKLRRELLRLKQEGKPVTTTIQHVKNWIKEVGLNHAVFLSEKSKNGNTRKITRQMLEQGNLANHKLKLRSGLVKTLRKIGGYPDID